MNSNGSSKNVKNLLIKGLALEFLSQEEGVFLYQYASTPDLMLCANEIRKIHKKDGKVTWIIDRNSNTTNVCTANCKFCNFYRIPGHTESYITSIDQYKQKIEEMFRYGGEQLLLQGGHHPELGLSFYVNLFKELKSLYPNLKLHALGPPEIAHICKLENKSHEYVLSELIKAGLDSLPGAGAEILNDRVRRIISRGKCTGREWLDIMRVAHRLGLTTSATMMFGHIETLEERFEHLVLVRKVQSEKPKSANGFLAFIPWTFQDVNTILKRIKGVTNTVTAEQYIRMLALSRIMLPNVQNIQVSWLTVGPEIAQICLHAGANDMGSIMIEENVISAAGANYRFNAQGMQDCIRQAGFKPQLRDQQYNYRTVPVGVEESVV